MPKGLPEGIDSIGGEYNLGDGLNNVEAVLAEFAQEYIRDASNNLQAAGAVSSGELIKSMRFLVSPVNAGYRLSILVADYYDFVNKGVKGVKSSDKAPNSPYSFKTLSVGYEMANSIQRWAVRHNLKAVNQNKQFKHKAVKTFQDTGLSTAFAIATGIKKKGLRATYFWDKAYDKLMPGLAPKLAKALQQDVATILRGMVVKRGEIT
jgi:hypothetical protein